MTMALKNKFLMLEWACSQAYFLRSSHLKERGYTHPSKQKRGLASIEKIFKNCFFYSYRQTLELSLLNFLGFCCPWGCSSWCWRLHAVSESLGKLKIWRSLVGWLLWWIGSFSSFVSYWHQVRKVLPQCFVCFSSMIAHQTQQVVVLSRFQAAFNSCAD